jgi:hypothetical protein
LKSIYNYVKQSDSELAGMLDIFELSSERQKELCLTLLAMISIKNQHSILRNFREENNLIDERYNAFISQKAIERNKTLIATSLLYNTEFSSSAFLLCSYMGQNVQNMALKFIETVRRDGFEIQNVPGEFQIDNIIIPITAVTQSGRSLPLVKNKSFEVCLAAVKKYAFAIENIIETAKDFSQDEIYAISEAAVMGKGETLRYIFPKRTTALPFSEQQINNLCMLAVKNNGLALAFVPVVAVSKELCLAAVTQSSSALRFVPRRVPWFNEIKDVFKKQRMIEEELEAESTRYLNIAPEEIEYYEDDEKKSCLLVSYPYSLEGSSIRLPEQVGDKGYELEIGENFLKEHECPSMWITSRNYRISEKALEAMKFELIMDFLPNDIDENGYLSSIPEDLKKKELKQNEKIKAIISEGKNRAYIIIQTVVSANNKNSYMRRPRLFP